MSYPSVRYTGDVGAVSATYRPADTPPDLVTARNRVGYVATGASTNGEFGLYRWTMEPRSGGAEPHYHRTISESFFVLSGQVRLYDGRTWVEAPPATSCTCRSEGSTPSPTTPMRLRTC